MKPRKSPALRSPAALLSRLCDFCAYRHLYSVLSSLRKGGKMSEQVRAGRNIALLGVFCPIFWFALFSGAPAATLRFHMAHSGIVFFIGLTIMIAGLIKQKE